MIRLAVDTGGTFTDLVIYDDRTGELQIHKVLSTSKDPSIAVLNGIAELLKEGDQNYADVQHVVHGTTVASNVVLERKGTPTALITTKGFRDVLLIGREKRHDLFDLNIEKPRPLIPRRLILEVEERTSADGTELIPLDTSLEAQRVAEQIDQADVISVAIAFINAYVNPKHEQQLGQALTELCPELYISLSSDVAPQWREYERFNTTAVNAYVMPTMRAYLERLQAELRQVGIARHFFIMQSNGGIVTADTAVRYPVRVIESGPAAGALAAAWYGRAAGRKELLSFDMGGTTAKVCLIREGSPQVRDMFEIDQVALRPRSGLPLNIPSIDLLEIGAGGGSIARENLGLVDVGPDSAGADPGPLCYGKEGQAPTVTDANLILGYLDPDFFLGGRMRLDPDRAWRGVEELLARPLAISTETAAWAIHEVATAKMASTARAATVNRGVDPRDLTLVAFGGAGPLHACRMARTLDITEVLVPAYAGVASAVGLLMADFRFDFVITDRLELVTSRADTINQIFQDLEDKGRQLLSESVDAQALQLAQFLRSVDLRYLGQGYELNLRVPGGAVTTEIVNALRADFHRQYEAEYGFSDSQEAVEAINWRLTALVVNPQDLVISSGTADNLNLKDAVKGRRRAYFAEVSDYISCPIYDRYRLPVGVEFDGPAIVEEVESTLVIPPRSTASLDERGNILVLLEP